MAQELLTLQNLAKYYTSAQSVVVGLNQTNLTFCRGEFVAITGESGSGKSTLAHVLGGILPYEGGELLYKGKPTSHYDSGDWERYRRDCVSFISQSYGILPGSSVLDNVTCALRLTGVDKSEAHQKAEEILKKVELWDLRYRRAAKLSSGQKQRLSIARALAKSAPVLIADEPTGNLDAENSTMVISLLAEAAKDRLVILITHEFSEAADSVTRHIELHDGRVTMDVQLRDVPELPAPAPKTVKAEGKKGLGWFVARFQIKARPVWSVLMLCLFAATVFAMFAISGTFIANLDDTFTYNYDNSAFRNGESCRIVVARTDQEDMTGEDVEKLLGVKYVDSLEEYGCVTDIQYAYREGVDYEIKNGVATVGSGLGADYVTIESYSLRKYQNNMPFVHTIPALPEGEEFLAAGRLPENVYEVVAAGGEGLLGRKITVLIQDQKNWGADDFLRMEVTVVGVTNHGYHLYFHEDLGRILTTRVKLEENLLYIPLPEEPSIMGWESTNVLGDGRTMVYYKTIRDPVIGKMSEAEAQLRQRIIELIPENFTFWEDYFESFTLDSNPVSLHYTLTSLEFYAGFWGEGEPVTALLLELGLDSESRSELSDQAWTSRLWNTLNDPETKEYIKRTMEPVLDQAQAAYMEVKEDFLAKDPDQLAIEELKDYLRRLGDSIPKDPRPIQRGEMVVSETLQSSLVAGLNQAASNESKANFLFYQLTTLGGLGEEKVFTILSATDTGYRRAVLVHPEDFEELLYPGKGDQVSVYVEDYAYVDRVLADIHAMGYAALSPYQEGAVTQNEELAEQRSQTLRVCILALVAVIALQILLLRAMFSMETEGYRLLSHIGLNGVTAKRSVLWQILLFALGGQLLGVGLIGACAAGGVDQLVHILRYLPLSYRLVLCLLHLGASIFTAVWTMKALEKQVFPQSGAEPDLDWDVLDEGVEA